MSKRIQFSIAVIGLFLLGGLLAWRLPQTSFATSVVDLLPGTQKEVKILRELGEKEQGSLLTVRLYSGSEPVTSEAIDQFQASLAQSDAIAETWVVGEDAFRKAGTLLYEKRYEWLLPGWLERSFNSGETDELPSLDQIAVEVADRLDDWLADPEGFALEETIPSDPFLLLGELRDLQQLGTPDQPSGEALLWVKQVKSPFGDEGQGPVFDALEQALADAKKGLSSLEMEYTGVAVFAEASKAGIKKEIQRLNLLGLVFVLFISLLFLRKFSDSIRIILVLLGSLLAAATTVVLLFPTVHILALVIGSILTGVAVDYAFHLILVEGRHDLPRKEVRKAVITGSVSSAMGFIFLIGAPLPFLRQVGAFVGGGLLAALVVAILLSAESKERQFPEKWRPRPFSWPRWTGPALLLLVIPGILNLKWQDSIKDLEYPLPEIKAVNERLVSQASVLEDQSLVIAYGEDLLVARDNLEALTSAAGSQAIVLDPGRWIPRFEDSRRVQAYFQSHRLFPSVLMEELESRGYVKEAFLPFTSEWKAYLKRPITRETYIGDISQFAGTLPGPLGNFVHSGDSLSWFGVLLSKAPEVTTTDSITLDQKEMLSESFKEYRQVIILFAGACLGTILVGMLFVYGLGPGVAAVSLPALGLLAAYGLSGYIHNGIGLFHVVGGLLAFCICLDYSIFSVQSFKHRTRLPASVGISAVTTVGVFEILSTSQIPGVNQLAQTVVFCIGFTLLFSLSAWPFLRAPANPLNQCLEHLPHGKEARLIDDILAQKGRTLSASGVASAREDMPTECLIEALAQTAAAWLILTQGTEAKRRFGMLIVVQDCQSAISHVPAQSRFITEVESHSDAKEGLLMFNGKCRGTDGVHYLTASFSIFIPPEESEAE